MSFELNNSLNLICEEITRRCLLKETLDCYDLKLLLNRTNFYEKCLIAKHFCKSKWEFGSLRILALLQELRIFTATEFILSPLNVNDKQLILNDFLEAHFEVITNLFIADAFNDSLNDILNECLRGLFIDLLKDPNLNNLNYLTTTKETLPTPLKYKIIQKHLGIILDLHSCATTEAYSKFSAWINEGVDHIKFTKDLYEKLLCDNAQETLSHLFKLSTLEDFKGWKFYLILLQTIASKCSHDVSIYLRKYLRTRLQHVAALPDENALSHLLLTARAATATTTDINKNLDSYANWYKQNIGEMKFVLKTEEFKHVITMLVACIDFEMEMDYLEIHSTISISPPVLCGKMVQNYKSKCKLRLSCLKAQCKSPQSDSILIEDSD